MTRNQKNLLHALCAQGGVRDRVGRVLAEGVLHPLATVQWCFHHGWIVSDGKRISITKAGRKALSPEQPDKER